MDGPHRFAPGFSPPGDEEEARARAMVSRRTAALRRAAEEANRGRLARDRIAAAVQRSDAAMQRAQVARRLAVRARERYDHVKAPAGPAPSDADRQDRLADLRQTDADERERLADQRETDADERERLADQREAEADERERRADERERMAELRELAHATTRPAEGQGGRLASLTGVFLRFRDEQARLRSQSARLADQMADGAEAFASWLEASAARGDRERRLAAASSERDAARMMRENAARWRAEAEERTPGTRNPTGSGPVKFRAEPFI